MLVFLVCGVVVAAFVLIFRLPDQQLAREPAPELVSRRHQATDRGHNRLFPAATTLAVFEQPQNGYREAVPRRAWLWMLLFGIFYLIARQLWVHVAIVALVIVGSVGIDPWLLFWVGLPVWFFYVRKADSLIIANYYRRGWKRLDYHDATFAPEDAHGARA